MIRAVGEYWRVLLDYRRTRSIERLDAEHMATRCKVCFECTRCNFRPCTANGGRHTSRHALSLF